MRGGRSRNKVAVGEPAAGSPPNYQTDKENTINIFPIPLLWDHNLR